MCFVPRQQKGLKNLHLCCLSVKIRELITFVSLDISKLLLQNDRIKCGLLFVLLNI